MRFSSRYPSMIETSSWWIFFCECVFHGKMYAWVDYVKFVSCYKMFHIEMKRQDQLAMWELKFQVNI